ncbi:MAG: DUF3604 domain-containing protein [Acidobacteria bacterium]|nr:DUF3604 domain-containing protein [Acidobacteriota bacterium]
MTQKRTMAIAGTVAVVCALPFLFSQQRTPGTAAPRALMNSSAASLRIEFGVTDRQGRSWDGSVEARAGEVLGVRHWRQRPNDEITGAAWKLATRKGVNFVLRAWETERLRDPQPYLNAPGVVVDVTGSAATELTVKTANGAFTVRPFDVEPGAPVQRLDGAVLVHRVASAERVSSEQANSDFPAIVTLGNDRVLTAWVSYRDNKNEILTREYSGASWGAVRAVGAGHSDIQMVKLARDGRGQAWAVWSAQVSGNWDVYASRLSGDGWSVPTKLSTDSQPDIYPVAASDAKGNVWVAWQGFRNGKSDVVVRRMEGGNWSAEERVSTSPANDWAPAIAADGKGSVYVAWDSYDKGNYDVQMRRWDGSRWGDVMPVAGTPKFEANVSLACDKENRLWATWNEAGMDWGKDTGFLPRKQGTPLYRDRWVGLAIYDGAKWMEPAVSAQDGMPAGLRHYNDMPVVSADPSGRVWLFFRHRKLRIADTPSDTPAHRAAWEIQMTTVDGGRWRTPVPLPFTNGRQDMRYGFTAAADAMFAVWPMDNRDFEEFLFTRADVYAARLPLPAAPAGSIELRPRVEPQLRLFPTHYEEAKDLARIHEYTADSSGRKYRIYRGDTHRHTEFSMDGNNDGSLLDTYRYAIDVAELDFLLVSEHNGAAGPDKDYVNWLLQQHADLFTVQGKFIPFYGYERSLNYPNGHRNVLFTKRGVPTLPIRPEEQKGAMGAKMLYDYLKKYNGIAISHTSASNMGTDWRDNDPAVEPLVEIYQGDRVSAEYEGAPKAANAGNPASAPGGFRPAGYVWNAWAKGYKLGVQVASDHLSTHISYACTLAEEFTREGLINAMKARHSYGATDNIILDYRMKHAGKEHLQGDILDAKAPFELTVKVLGTQPVRQIDIIRSQQFVLTKHPMQREVEFTFRDAQPVKGESYYYVRVIQADDQVAWSSPIWIKR